MSAGGIAEALVDLLRTIDGVENVEQEEPEGTDEPTGLAARTTDAVVTFWRVAVWPTQGEEGAGYVEPRYRIRVRGFYGIAREAPDEGVASDVVFRELAALVFQTLQDPVNRNPADCVETSVPEIAPRAMRRVPVGAKRVACHVAEITYTAQEE